MAGEIPAVTEASDTEQHEERDRRKHQRRSANRSCCAPLRLAERSALTRLGVDAAGERAGPDPLEGTVVAVPPRVVASADVPTLAQILVAPIERLVLEDVLERLPHFEGLDVAIQQLLLDEVKLLDDPLEVIVNHDLHGDSLAIAAEVRRSLATVSTLH